MFATVILLCSTCGMVFSSGLHPVAPAGAAPIVTAASSQYFERIYNRLVAANPVFEPVLPVAPLPLPPPIAVAPVRPILQVFPVASAQPEVVDAVRTTSVPVNPTNPPQSQNSPVEPNVAIAVATAHAAAPVATILLPPYPFGLPTSFGLIPQPAQVPVENPNENREMTTRKSTTIGTTTTERQQENITPAPSNIDNSFAQALPSNDNVNFRQYYAPQTLSAPKPQKLKTTVEVVPVPLQYIAPPPLNLHHHHQHHHHHHHHQALKVVPHFHSFVPKSHKIIIRPISGPIRGPTRVMRIPAGLVTYGPPKLVKKISQNYSQNIRMKTRDIEPTTFRSINRPTSKPRRV